MKRYLVLSFLTIVFAIAGFGSYVVASVYYDTKTCGMDIGWNFCSNVTTNSIFKHEVMYVVDKQDSNSYYVDEVHYNPQAVYKANPYYGWTYVGDSNETIYFDSLKGHELTDFDYRNVYPRVTLENTSTGKAYGYIEIHHAMSSAFPQYAADKTIVDTQFDY